MAAPLQHIDFHPNLYPALQVVWRGVFVEQRRHLHAETALMSGAFVYFPILPQGPVRLHWVAVTVIRVDVGHFAAGGME